MVQIMFFGFLPVLFLTLVVADRLAFIVGLGWVTIMLSVDDVNKAFDNYSKLREAFLRNPPHNVLPQAPDSELTTKAPRKRRSDAV